MKSALLKKSDYTKLVKMSLNEVTGFLESTEYKKEIDEVALIHKGMQLAEIAINKNLSNTHKKLRRITPMKLRQFLDIYLMRHDLYNVKTSLRAKYTGETEIEHLMEPYALPIQFLKDLMKKATMEEMLAEVLDRPTLKKIRDKSQNLVEIENMLDKEYYSKVIEITGKSLFRQFLENEIEIRNIINIFRFKREGMDRGEIQKYLISSPSKTVKRLAGASLEDLPGIIENSKYGKHAKHGLDEYKKKGTLIYLETSLFKHLLESGLKMLHQRPLKADAIFGYLFAKEIEARNLKMLIKSKQLGLQQEFVEGQIVA